MRVAAALLASALGSLPVRAETVRMVAGGATGGGWTYAYDGECYVVTARHVVAREDGSIALPLMVDAAGIEGQGVEPALPPDTLRVGGELMDAARFRVVGALRTHCRDDLGYQNLDATLARLRDTGQPLYVSKVLPRGSEEIVPAAIIALNRDNDRFTLRPSSGADTVVQSDSGSPVRMRSDAAVEQGLPLGLVTDSLDDGTALVLRMDAIRRWATTAARSAAATTGLEIPLRIAAWSGVTLDPNCGPANLLDPKAACGWRARPLPNTGGAVDLDLDVGDGAVMVAEIHLTLEPGAHLSGVEVLVPDGQAWQSARYCRVTPGALAQVCAFLPRAAKTVRLRFAGLVGGIRSVEVR